MTGQGSAQGEAGTATNDERRLIDEMAKRNPVFRLLGIEIELAEPGHTRFAMTMRAELTNTFGSGHGGIIFTLADMAFGFTCNAGGERALTASAAIDYLAPAPVGPPLPGAVGQREPGADGLRQRHDPAGGDRERQ